jgi:hypothetical protein
MRMNGLPRARSVLYVVVYENRDDILRRDKMFQYEQLLAAYGPDSYESRRRQTKNASKSRSQGKYPS